MGDGHLVGHLWSANDPGDDYGLQLAIGLKLLAQIRRYEDSWDFPPPAPAPRADPYSALGRHVLGAA